MIFNRKYEFIVCEDVHSTIYHYAGSTSYYIRKTKTVGYRIITYSHLYVSPECCFNEKYPNIVPEVFLDVYSGCIGNQTVVSEAETLEKLKLEIPEYLI
jgi:hypothetical protein